MKREATISADGLYRYDLTRTVQAGCNCERCNSYFKRYDPGHRPPPFFVLFALCNPSTADAETDDATERRGWGFTHAWGYPSFKFVNTNPSRSTDPKKARMPDEAVIALNDLYLVTHAQAASVVVCAWGTSADPILARRTKMILLGAAPEKVHFLALTSKGVPKHPLYLPGDLLPQRWNT